MSQLLSAVPGVRAWPSNDRMSPGMPIRGVPPAAGWAVLAAGAPAGVVGAGWGAVGEHATTSAPLAAVAKRRSAARRVQVKPCIQEATSGILIELIDSSSGSRMRFSVALGQGAMARDRTIDDVVDDYFTAADEAERLGLYGVWLGDHMVFPREV